MLAVHNASTTKYGCFNREVRDHFLTSSFLCIVWMERTLLTFQEVEWLSNCYMRTKDMEFLTRAPLTRKRDKEKQ
jgi:hypothetical protein